MSKRGALAIVTMSALFIFVIAQHAVARMIQPGRANNSSPSIPKITMMHGYNGYASDSREHCFYADNSRSLFFDAYTDSSANGTKVSFYLYSLENGVYKDRSPAENQRTITVYNNKIIIQILPDAPPHLGPGPYTAMITISSPNSGLEQGAKSVTRGYYFYETWPQTDSGSSDCWYRP